MLAPRPTSANPVTDPDETPEIISKPGATPESGAGLDQDSFNEFLDRMQLSLSKNPKSFENDKFNILMERISVFIDEPRETRLDHIQRIVLKMDWESRDVFNQNIHHALTMMNESDWASVHKPLSTLEYISDLATEERSDRNDLHKSIMALAPGEDRVRGLEILQRLREIDINETNAWATDNIRNPDVILDRMTERRKLDIEIEDMRFRMESANVAVDVDVAANAAVDTSVTVDFDDPDNADATAAAVIPASAGTDSEARDKPPVSKYDMPVNAEVPEHLGQRRMRQESIADLLDADELGPERRRLLDSHIQRVLKNAARKDRKNFTELLGRLSIRIDNGFLNRFRVNHGPVNRFEQIDNMLMWPANENDRKQINKHVNALVADERAERSDIFQASEHLESLHQIRIRTDHGDDIAYDDDEKQEPAITRQPASGSGPAGNGRVTPIDNTDFMREAEAEAAKSGNPEVSGGEVTRMDEDDFMRELAAQQAESGQSTEIAPDAGDDPATWIKKPAIWPPFIEFPSRDILEAIRLEEAEGNLDDKMKAAFNAKFEEMSIRFQNRAQQMDAWIFETNKGFEGERLHLGMFRSYIMKDIEDLRAQREARKAAQGKLPEDQRDFKNPDPFCDIKWASLLNPESPAHLQTVARWGHGTLVMQDKGVLKADNNGIYVPRGISGSEMAGKMAVIEAVERGWTTINISGSPDFVKAARQEAVNQGLGAKIVTHTGYWSRSKPEFLMPRLPAEEGIKTPVEEAKQAHRNLSGEDGKAPKNGEEQPIIQRTGNRSATLPAAPPERPIDATSTGKPAERSIAAAAAAAGAARHANQPAAATNGGEPKKTGSGKKVSVWALKQAEARKQNKAQAEMPAQTGKEEEIQRIYKEDLAKDQANRDKDQTRRAEAELAAKRRDEEHAQSQAVKQEEAPTETVEQAGHQSGNDAVNQNGAQAQSVRDDFIMTPKQEQDFEKRVREKYPEEFRAVLEAERQAKAEANVKQDGAQAQSVRDDSIMTPKQEQDFEKRVREKYPEEFRAVLEAEKQAKAEANVKQNGAQAQPVMQAEVSVQPGKQVDGEQVEDDFGKLHEPFPPSVSQEEYDNYMSRGEDIWQETQDVQDLRDGETMSASP